MRTGVPAENTSVLSVPVVLVTEVNLRRTGLITDEARVITQYILYGGLLTFISSFGVLSNIINIVCFVRQGLRDPVNVSLLGLAISDLGSLITSLGSGICFNPALLALDLPVEMMDFVYLAVFQPHILFTAVSSWITALVTLERCLCITRPVQVKSIITPKRVTIIIISIFIFFTSSASPIYFVGGLSWVFSPGRNRTVLRRVSTNDWAIVEQFSYTVNNALIPFMAYFTIIICTIVLVVKLQNKAKWRRAVTAVASADSTSKRDQKVARMVMMISILFISCFSPLCISAIVVTFVPELDLYGPNQNLVFVYAGISIVLESANSSANIFIYYHMSSRYRFIFRNMFGCAKVDNKHRK